MKIIKSRISSKCTDGSIVNECTLDIPVSDGFLQSIQAKGEVSTKQLGNNTLFTFSCDLFSMKGMVGDTIIYVSHRKEDADTVQSVISSIFEKYP
ncbi:MAG TPA: hypothetical protein VN429_07180 [Methanospirillum sp.]|uniref:hypothetical protein n=1 Tax=Methanospirillum sp. TaxID=45200 RepID=UPI002B885B9D|nr:hypothetical protein [Methanospirillum sp.]HWQ64184.1 hypothetical protein [Methanospirillum sp.]